MIVLLFCAAAVPLGLILAGLSPTAALATAGGIAAFAVGVTHQVLGLISDTAQDPAPAGPEEAR